MAVSTVFLARAEEAVVFITIGTVPRHTCAIPLPARFRHGILSLHTSTLQPLVLYPRIKITFAFYTTKALEFSCTPSISIVIYADHCDPIPIDWLSIAMLFSNTSGPWIKVRAKYRSRIVFNVPNLQDCWYATVPLSDTIESIYIAVCTSTNTIIIPTHLVSHPFKSIWPV